MYLRERVPALKAGKRTAQELALCWWAYKGKALTQLPDVCTAIRTKWVDSLAPATIRNRIRYLTSACRWAWRHHNLCEHDPAARVIVPKVDNERQVYIDRHAMLRVARAIKPTRAGSRWLDARAVLLVAFYSGMRLGECLRAKPTPDGWSLPDTKNGRPRIIPIHAKVQHLARRWPCAINPRPVQKWFTKACEALGITGLRVHDLRHSTASAMINAGVDLYTVGAVLGHKSAQSTRRYSHLATTTLADALGKVGRKSPPPSEPAAKRAA